MRLNYDQIGKNIKRYRMAKDMKQEQLAELVGVSPAHISHIECAKTKVSLPLLTKLSKTLGVSLYAILGTDMSGEIGLDAELAATMKDASPWQKALCIELCKAVVSFERKPE